MRVTDNTICKARGGMQTCPYHRHVLAMYKAAERGIEGQEAYYQARKVVEQMLLDGWAEDALLAEQPVDPFTQVERMRATVATPVQHQAPASRRVQVDPSAAAARQSVTTKSATPTTQGTGAPRRRLARETVPVSSRPLNDGSAVKVRIGREEIVFYRARPGVTAAEPQHIRIEANRPLTDEELRLMNRHLRFAYKQHINSRGGNENKVGALLRDGRNAFVVPADMSLSNRPNLAKATADFQRTFARNIGRGTPANQDGVQTLGGLGDATPSIAVYYDSVTIDTE